MPNRIWTPDELRILREEREAGTPVPVIAAMLNRPKPACYTRLLMLGIVVQPHRPATPEERARLAEMVSLPEPPTDEAIAAELGRTVGSVRYMLQGMGLVGSRDLSRQVRRTPRARVASPAQLEARAARAAEREAERLAVAGRREARIAAKAEREAAVAARRAERARAAAERREAADAERLRRAESRVGCVRAAEIARPAAPRSSPVARKRAAALVAEGRPAVPLLRPNAVAPAALSVRAAAPDPVPGPVDAGRMKADRLALIREIALRRQGTLTRPAARLVGRAAAGVPFEDDDEPLGLADVADAVDLPGMRSGIAEFA